MFDYLDNNPQTKLEIKNLRVSFRTNNGAVKAVRDISCDLYEGETLTIVGESGSGKSVTARAVMGILAPNAIIESGEIIYDGLDLLKITEDEFHRLRGNRLAMIFQDPLSSLNPIMKVGKQLTEAMILNGRETRRDGKKRLRAKLAQLAFAAEHLLKRTVKDYKFSFSYTAGTGSASVGMSDLALIADIIEASDKEARTYQDIAKQRLGELLPIFKEEKLNKTKCLTAWKDMSDAVEKGIDKIAIRKDSLFYVFRTSLRHAIDTYFEGVAKNPAELARVERDEKVFRKLTEKGKFAPSVVPANLIDTELARRDMVKTVENLVLHYSEDRVALQKEKLAEEMLAYLQEQAAASKRKFTKSEHEAKAVALLREVGIPDPEKRMKQYPFQMSGGQRQRVVIAIALAANPDILICDEPTTALDVTIQAQILELINQLKRDRKLSVIFITHDLGVVANMADRIAVMYAGKIVEQGNAQDIFYDPRHPYTWALLSSMPTLDTKERLAAIPGTPPNMILPPKGDAFAARNQYAMEIDFEEEPPFFKVSDTHYAATWLLHPDAPKVSPPEIIMKSIQRMKAEEAARREVKDNAVGI
jgi:oligopeptide/dipeptide ABC transporter ATP-binding protein